MNDEDKRKIPPNDDWAATAPPNYELSPNPPPAQSAEDRMMAAKPSEKRAPEKTPDKWEMPKPEFRISSGSSPKDFTQSGLNFQLPKHHRHKKQAEQTDEGLSKLYAPTERENPDDLAHKQNNVEPENFEPEHLAAQQISVPGAAGSQEPSFAAAAPALAIEPQPEISEEFPAPALETEKSPEQAEASSNGVVRVIFGVLGLLTMFFFAIAFLMLIYFLFFYKAGAE